MPRFAVSATVLGSPDPIGLGRFYADLLGWPVVQESPEWVRVRPARGPGLSFQLEPDHVRPVWPAGPGDAQMQAHLDIGVDDLADGVAQAESLGAELAAFQPQDDVRVMLDPAGHPFCLFRMPKDDPRW
jgi:catechol 2,3-dioxygenase-like lactoylglutathione lyase family enzyme